MRLGLGGSFSGTLEIYAFMRARMHARVVKAAFPPFFSEQSIVPTHS